MRWMLIGLAGVVCLGGCASKKSSLLLERQARGPIEEEGEVAKAANWRLEPVMQTQAKNGVEVNVNFCSHDYLKNFFANRNVFGAFAGANPYYAEHMVFYVKIANKTDKRIRINPVDFTLVDDYGNQYSVVGVDYVTAFAEAKKPVSTTTRGLLENASPGYFGFSLPVGKMLAAKPQDQFARLQLSSLQSGYLYPGVVHDGLIAFWNPVLKATKLHLFLGNIKTNLNANDEPTATVDLMFDFLATINK